MSFIGANLRRDLEIHRYPLLVYGLVPLAALVLQAWLPRILGQYAYFDLPLVVTIYFALGRRSPIQGTLMGAALGLFEDALSHLAIGLNGIAKSVAGYLAASVGVRIDVENRAIRVTLTFLLSLLLSGHLSFCFALPAGPRIPMELALGAPESGRKFGDRAVFVSDAGLAAIEGLSAQIRRLWLEIPLDEALRQLSSQTAVRFP